MDKEGTSSANAGRRDFIKKAAYVAPAILTLAVAPAYAKAGSQKPEKKPKKVRVREMPATGKGRMR